MSMVKEVIHTKKEERREILTLLKKAYVDELETVANYTAHSVNLDTFDGRDVAEDLREDIEEELTHAQTVGERIKILGGTVPTSMHKEFVFSQEKLNQVSETTDVEGVVDGVIEAEKTAINTYREIIEVAEKAKDYGTVKVARDLLEDEERHLEEFLSLKKSF